MRERHTSTDIQTAKLETSHLNLQKKVFYYSIFFCYFTYKWFWNAPKILTGWKSKCCGFTETRPWKLQNTRTSSNWVSQRKIIIHTLCTHLCINDAVQSQSMHSLECNLASKKLVVATNLAGQNKTSEHNFKMNFRHTFIMYSWLAPLKWL
jgi:hypothetical protein